MGFFKKKDNGFTQVKEVREPIKPRKRKQAIPEIPPEPSAEDEEAPEEEPEEEMYEERVQKVKKLMPKTVTPSCRVMQVVLDPDTGLAQVALLTNSPKHFVVGETLNL